MKNETASTTRTTETVTISRAEYDRLEKENQWLSGRVRWLEEQLKVLAKGHFGSRHETALDEVIGQMAILFNEPEAYAHLEETGETAAAVPEQKPEKKKRIFVLDKLPENAEVEVEKHELSETERTCPVCGAVMEPVGEEVVRTLKIIPAKFVVHEDCNNCDGEDTEEDIGKKQFAKTPHVPAVYPGSYCSPEAAAYLMTQKFVMGSPLYRMEMDFNRSGFELSRQTMSNWMIYCAETWLAPIYDRLHQMLLLEATMRMKRSFRCFMSQGGKLRRRATYGSTAPDGIRIIRSFCTSTGRGGEANIHSTSFPGSRDTCKRTVMWDMTLCRM